MIEHAKYTPGPASGARVEKNGDKWTLVLVRQLRHAPATVWAALTDPAQLREWAPFDADRNMGAEGATVKLTTVGAPAEHVTETRVSRAEPGKLLAFNWGGQEIKWELEPSGGGTRLTLWHNIDRNYIAMGAAGWHLCLDILDRAHDGDPVGRIVGRDAMTFDGWHRLHAEYAKEFGVEMPKWGAKGQ